MDMIYSGRTYSALVTDSGELIVARNKPRNGLANRAHYRGETTSSWVENIKRAATNDPDEAHALCRALMPTESTRIRSFK